MFIVSERFCLLNIQMVRNIGENEMRKGEKLEKYNEYHQFKIHQKRLAQMIVESKTSNNF